MSAGESSPPDWSDFDIPRLVGAGFPRPLVTEQQRTLCEDQDVRVEHNAIRNAATSEVGQAIRLVPADDARYTAVTLPVLDDGRLVFLGRYRYAIDRWSVEAPRFTCQTRDTGWKRTAQSGLLKYVGLKAAQLTLLGAVQPDTARLGTSAIVILATACTQRSARPTNLRELIAGTVAIAPDEVNRLIRSGEISCGITLAALQLRAAHARG